MALVPVTTQAQPLPRSELASFLKNKRQIDAFEQQQINTDEIVTKLNELIAIVAQILGEPFLTWEDSPELTADKALIGGVGLTFVPATATMDLDNTAVVAGLYGANSKTISVTIDQQGRITGANEYDLDTDNITEGVVNLFYTNARARAALSDGTGIDYTSATGVIALDTASTRNTDHALVTLTAGAGLTGGGDITGNRSFAVGAGTGITVNADDVALTVPTASGSYTPTLDNLSNVDSVTMIGTAKYMRVGSGVTVSLLVSVDPTVITAATGFNVSLPAGLSSNFAGAGDCNGTAACGALQQSGFVVADATNDAARVIFLSTATSAESMSIIFEYEII